MKSRTRIGASMPGIEAARNVKTWSIRGAGRLLIIAALIATVAVPALLGGKAALLATLHFSIQGYIAIFASLVASWLCRTIKLYLLLRRSNPHAGFMHVLGISLATDFAFLATPAGIGGYAAGLYYLRRAGTSASGAAAIVAADQGFDALFFVVALPLAGLCLAGSAVQSGLGKAAFITTALIVTLVLGALITRRKLAEWLFTPNALSRFWPRLLSMQLALREFFRKLRTDGRALLAAGPAFLFGIFVLTAFQQLTRYGILWLALLFLGHRVSFLTTFLLQVLVLQAAVWTGIPAGGGAAEIGLSATLGGWVPNASLATALLLWRVATLYICLLAGAVAMAWLARRPTPGISASCEADRQRRA